MKKVIAIVAGGDSSEHDVSLRSAAGIDSWIDKEGTSAPTMHISPFTELREKMAFCRAISICSTSLTRRVVCWWRQ